MNNIISFSLRACGFILAFVLLIIGIALLVYGTFDSVIAIGSIFKDYSDTKVISGILKGIDLIFLGFVVQILGIGLYELFVGALPNIPEWLVFKDFDQLKLILIKAAITVIAISFSGKAITWSGGQEIIYYGVGVGTVIAALSYFIKIKSTNKET
ncbi:MAG: YqhA family protein [Bacteroidota bacterium]